MTDQPDDPPRRRRPPAPAGEAPATPSGPEGYPPPMFAPAAPAAEAGPEGYPPPTFAPAAESQPTIIVESQPATAIPEPLPPSPVSGAIASGTIASGATRMPAAAAAAPADEPLLPATYSENDLRTAIGSPAMPEQIRPRRARARDDDDDDAAPRSRKTVLVAAGALFVGLGIAALVILGRLNAGRYAVSCEAKQVAAERGRAFPPWGTTRLEGAAWKPIPIPPSFQCVGVETEDPAELGDAYRGMLVERARSLLTAKEVTEIEPASEMLEQALLHARSDSDAHKTARQEIQRMLGDVGYWRASAKLRKAADELADAAKQFEAAAGQLPRYVADANAWAAHVRKLVEELRTGPAGARTQALGPSSASQSPAPSARPAAPAGVALPVEPAAGSGSAGSDAPPPATPDAGIPSGGVLL